MRVTIRLETDRYATESAATLTPMAHATLADSALDAGERRTLDAFVQLLTERTRIPVRSIWLYGSRARGERSSPDSDIDLLIVLDAYDPATDSRIQRLLFEAAELSGGNPIAFSVRVWDRARIDHEREIGSFFIQEVDCEKVVIAGPP